MFTIKHAAELTGVPVATLRAWERRYGVVVPQRTEGGYRLYDGSAIATILEMNELVTAGWSPQQAAAQVLRTRSDVGGARGNGPPEAGGGTSPPPTDADLPDRASSDALIRAAHDLDTTALAAILDERFSRGSFESVVDDWLMPALHGIGDAWAAGELSTASEHLAAHAVLRRLSAAFEAAASRAFGPRILVGLAPGCHHELGALAFAAAARRAGLSVGYLGPNLPEESWLDAVGRDRPEAVVVAVPRPDDVAGTAAVIAAIRRAHPEVRTAVGGRHQDDVPEPAERLGHRIGAAATRLARALAVNV